MNVTWGSPFSGNSQVTGYIIQYWKESKSGSNHRLFEELVPFGRSYFHLKNLVPGTSYEMTVLAENDVGRGDPSNVVKVKTGEENPSAVPLDVIAESEYPTTILVTWKAPPEDTWNGQLIGYYVGYKIVSGNYGSSKLAFRTVNAGKDQRSFAYFLIGLKSGSEYVVTIKAYNRVGSGPGSQEIRVRTTSGDLPSSPTLYSFDKGKDSISLKWKLDKEEASLRGYSIRYRNQEEDSSWTQVHVDSLGENQGEYLLDGLVPNSIYSMFITATNDYGNGDPSQMVTVRTKPGKRSSSSRWDWNLNCVLSF